MLSTLASLVYSAYLHELRKQGARRSRRKSMLRKARRLLLKLGDPDIVVRLGGFSFMSPFSSNILLSHFEFPFYDAVLPRLAKTMSATRGKLVMIDVGANVGVVTYLVSRETAGRFYCIEANPRFKTSLTHNLEQIPQSRAQFAALTDEPGRTPVRHNYAEGNSNILPAGEGGVPLEFITLDEALRAEPGYRAPNLVKIDTEGYELKILRGASQTLGEHRPILFFEFFPDFIRREGGQPDEVFNLLRRQDYGHFVFYDGGGHLLTSIQSDEIEQARSLRLYCEVRRSFFDVAAFHSTDATLAEAFTHEEAEFFENFARSRAG